MFIVYGLSTGITFSKVFSGAGLINIFNMYLFMLIFLKIISTTDKLNKLTDCIIFWVLTRGVFGLVRWGFFGGDPANVYANQQNINVRITFFDINDNLIAMLGVFISAWILMYGKPGLSNLRKFFYLLTIIIGLAVILLSYRRTAWGGLVLAVLWFVWQQPWRRRIQVGFFASLIGLLALPVVISERFAKHGLLVDITSSTGKISTKIGRFTELNQAWRYISESPFTGVMPWGGLGTAGSHEYVHSGIIHLWLKGGVFALIFFCLILWGYYSFTKKARKEIPAQERYLLEAGFAGLLFILPSFMFGTTVAEFRSCLLIGFVLALPYLVYSLKKSEITTIVTSPYALKPCIKEKSI
jgi:O-antigen ligase